MLFGKLIHWHSNTRNRAYVPAKCLFDDVDSVPRSLVIQQGFEWGGLADHGLCRCTCSIMSLLIFSHRMKMNYFLGMEIRILFTTLLPQGTIRMRGCKLPNNGSLLRAT